MGPEMIRPFSFLPCDGALAPQGVAHGQGIGSMKPADPSAWRVDGRQDKKVAAHSGHESVIDLSDRLVPNLARMPSTPEFVRTPVWRDERLLLKSSCSGCGASFVGSRADGSLQQWEDGHKCEAEAETRDTAIRKVTGSGLG